MTAIEPRWISFGEPVHLLINLNQIDYVENDNDGMAVVHLISGNVLESSYMTTLEFIKAITEKGEPEPHYTKQDLLTRFKAGFETQLIEGFDTEMWRVDQSLTQDDELHLVMDDGPYDMTPKISDWNTDNLEIIKNQILRKIGDLPIGVWLGDVKIKEAE